MARYVEHPKDGKSKEITRVNCSILINTIVKSLKKKKKQKS